ncbi:MAG: large conductance mechanosensitive channel protein MscL [Actinomycetes bacterium]
MAIQPLQRSTKVLKEFRSFALRGNVIDLAVAVVIGGAFNVMISSVVKDMITPIVGAIFGQQDFSSLTFQINGSTFAYGNFINSLISFIVVVTAVFFMVVKPLSVLLVRLGLSDAESKQLAPCPRCLTEIPVAAIRCGHCTSDLKPDWAPVAPSETS